MSEIINALYSGSFKPNKPLTQLIKNLNTREINVADSAKMVPNQQVVNQVMFREKELNEDLILAQRVKESNDRIEEYKNIVRRGNAEREDKKGVNINLSV